MSDAYGDTVVVFYVSCLLSVFYLLNGWLSTWLLLDALFHLLFHLPSIFYPYFPEAQFLPVCMTRSTFSYLAWACWGFKVRLPCLHVPKESPCQDSQFHTNKLPERYADHIISTVEGAL